jgi:hypothetical protein
MLFKHRWSVQGGPHVAPDAADIRYNGIFTVVQRFLEANCVGLFIGSRVGGLHFEDVESPCCQVKIKAAAGQVAAIAHVPL